jgi:hypothetical protein
MASESPEKYQNLTILIISNISATNQRIFTKLLSNLLERSTFITLATQITQKIHNKYFDFLNN